MSTKLSKDLNNPWEELLSFTEERDEIRHEAQMLMYSFLSEVEKYQELQDITKKTLAQRIKKSASYLTQLFRGSKPLNFETIARFEKALSIKFHISSSSASDEMQVNEDYFLNLKCQYKTSTGVWVWKNLSAPKEDKYSGNEDAELIKNALQNYDDKAIPA